ncbi:uncharacterized protein DEA37_0005675 [Paragonimus westermani]|uniref:Uncharacterized protein n=1 Tax=Paragonimus westermani TaxID=34504 RepID=A0A5J4NYB3_9TREM|nr:uncharacterized protein DEA37_0005675 [Paragonimus westermani]
MNTVAELVEKFCWKSKTRSVWKDEPDLLDDAIARIHSEAAVFDAIIRSKNTTVPSLEKISRTVKFLEQNSFWRSNPFSLVTGTGDDPALARTTSLLQMKSVRDLWSQNKTQKPMTVSITPPQCPRCETQLDHTDSQVGSLSNTSKLAFMRYPDSDSSEKTETFKSPEARYVTLVNPKCMNFRETPYNNTYFVACDASGGTFRTYADAARSTAPFRT